MNIAETFSYEELARRLPLKDAMPALVGMVPVTGSVYDWVAQVAARVHPEIATGLWIYVDDIERAHTVAQAIENPTGSAWHAIVHRREGDFSNSLYWWRLAGTHPAFSDLANYDPAQFVTRVRNCADTSAVELVELQRQEWRALFAWVLAQVPKELGQ